MIHEALMGLGKWEVELDPATPRWVMARLHPRASLYGNLVVTAAKVPVDNGDRILDVARYTGVYRSQPSDFRLAGVGMDFYIGDETGIGGHTSTAPLSVGNPGALSAWIAALLPADLTLGSIGTQTGHAYSGYERMYRKDILADIVSKFGVEWHIRPNGVWDVDSKENLFRVTPRVAILARDSGRGLQITGLSGRFGLDRDGVDWVRRVRIFDSTGAQVASVDGGIADADVPYRAFKGSPIQRSKILSYSGAAPTEAATKDFNANQTIRQEVTLSTRAYDIHGEGLDVGDNVHVFDQDRGIHDLTNPVVGPNGQLIFPEVIRCIGLKYPVRAGMGVYFRRYVNVGGTWTVEWTDLSPYVVFEDGDTEVEVGARMRRMRRTSNA